VGTIASFPAIAAGAGATPLLILGLFEVILRHRRRALQAMLDHQLAMARLGFMLLVVDDQEKDPTVVGKCLDVLKATGQ
jgi:hypothetical protein